MAEHVGSVAGSLNTKLTGLRLAGGIGAVALVALMSVAGAMSYGIIDERRTVVQQSHLVDAARQGAINLTTIDHTTVDADIARILDTSTGVFHDDFQRRAKAFADVVTRAQSTSVGSVISVGLESRDGDNARVLVVMNVAMSSAGASEQAPQAWRMRIGVHQSGDDAKISDVEFVS